MQFDNDIPNIKGLIKKINNMSDNKERYRLYNILLHTLSFLHNGLIYTEDDLDNFLKELIDTERNKTNYLSSKERELLDMYKNLNTLNNIYKPILLNSKEHPFYMQSYMNVNLDKILYVGEAFLREIDINLYKLYEKLLKKDLIIEKYKHDKYGSCGYINGNLSGITLDMHIQNLYKVITLIHEMGHAYDNYLNKTQDKLSFQINTEVTSMTFELIFLYYLSENNILSSNEISVCLRNYFTDYLLRMNNAFIYNNLFIEKKLSKENNYLDFNQIKNNGIIFNNLASEYLQDIEVYCNYYGVGLMFASVFLEHFKRNSHNTIKEIKDFSCLAHNLTTEEILKYFPKSDLINMTSNNANKSLKKRY